MQNKLSKKEISEAMTSLANYRWSKTTKTQRKAHMNMMTEIRLAKYPPKIKGK